MAGGVMQFKQKRSWPYLLMATGLTAWLLAIQWMIWIQSEGLKKTDVRYQQFIEQARHNLKRAVKNQQLMDEISALESHPGRIEGWARESLNMIKKGELFYQIVPKPKKEPAESTLKDQLDN
jgi:cell division protein FtsB